MANDGSGLEALVSFVEEQFLPEGLSIRTREKVYENGVIVAELDVVVSGKVGTTDFSWLIECRDRPSEGPAPVSWIEQLQGRRERLKFNKVTAVSTTGFSEGARNYARQAGIEVREVESLSLDAFKDWIAATHMMQCVNTTNLERATLDFSAEDLATHGEALKQVLSAATASKVDVLRLSTTGELVKAANAFRAVMEPQQELWDQVEVNGAAKTVSVNAEYSNDDDHFVIDVNGARVRVRGVRYRGTLRRTETALPVANAREYKDGEKRTISQSVAYEPMNVGGTEVGIEFHRLPDLEGAFVVLRTIKED